MLNAERYRVPAELLSETGTTYPSPALQTLASTDPSSAAQGRSAQPRRESDSIVPTDSDPWSRMLLALLQFSDPPDEFPEELVRPRFPRPAVSSRAGRRELRTFTVTVLEQLANSLVALSWHDPTLCNYEEQIWSQTLSRRSGRCALSGMHISKGDSVYRPKTRGGVAPLNGDAMILASALRKIRDGLPEPQPVLPAAAVRPRVIKR